MKRYIAETQEAQEWGRVQGLKAILETTDWPRCRVYNHGHGGKSPVVCVTKITSDGELDYGAPLAEWPDTEDESIEAERQAYEVACVAQYDMKAAMSMARTYGAKTYDENAPSDDDYVPFGNVKDVERARDRKGDREYKSLMSLSEREIADGIAYSMRVKILVKKLGREKAVELIATALANEYD